MILFSKTEADASYYNAPARNLCNALQLVLFIKNYKKSTKSKKPCTSTSKISSQAHHKSHADYLAMLSGSF